MNVLRNRWHAACIGVLLVSATGWAMAQGTIDRESLVRRHTIHISRFDSLSSLTVGNGNFAFTVDATGMQSFPGFYANGVALGTESTWGWHRFPNTEGLRIEEAQKVYDLDGRKISYTVQLKEPERSRKAVEYFRVNPHRLQLGNIGLEMLKKDGSVAGVEDIHNIDQQLDPWTGIITSSFEMDNEKVRVTTSCHHKNDVLAFKIESSLLQEKRIRIRLRFPYPNGQFKDVGINWSENEKHLSTLYKTKDGGEIRRVLDDTRYYVYLQWKPAATIQKFRDHYFLLEPSGTPDTFEFTCQFSEKKELISAEDYEQTVSSSVNGWRSFWRSGGAVDFSGSTDPRAFEIERRVILSQYLTRVQCASGMPPQETGLTYNSWYGKPHLEMHWWHAVHFAQWGRPELLQKSLDWYFTIARKAKEIAKRQGMDGLRWQKMTDPEGDEAPSSVGSFLIWQQPHFIYMAEMLYRSNPSKKILSKYRDLLFETADFMASYPTYDSSSGRYNLGKGLIPAQECFDAMTTYNPTYELAYWSWALEMAQQWRLRLGLKRKESWDTVIRKLAPLPVKDGVYLATESTPDCYEDGSRYLTDHPAVLAAYSTIPAANGLDTTIMRNTLQLVLKKWQWNETWGWDFPLTAMTAARLHMGETAVSALLMPIQTNTYLVNGHNFQDSRLTIYLPGNGGLLSAVAMMCTGTDADRDINSGFPKDGTWHVKWEGLKKMF